ncbi:MAG: ribosome silencing factor [Myxococcales bacterium]|nr:ribosome silencing factor [Myxococcales bacterium]
MEDALRLAEAIADALADKKAEDIVILEVEKLVGYTSYFVICTGRSDRQVKAIADQVVRKLRTDHRVRPLGSEGAERSSWVILDYGDVVAHVFRQDERDFYDLEGLWRDAPQVAYEPAASPAAG